MVDDACKREIMQRYGKWSARAAQAVAKCRKARGIVHKSKAGSNLRRWGREKWQDKITGKPCGAGGGVQYCRPTKHVSGKTPVMPRGKRLAQAVRTKQATGHAPAFRRP